MDRQTKRKSSPSGSFPVMDFFPTWKSWQKNHVSDINFPRKEGEKWAGRRSMRPSLEAIVLTCRFDPPLDYSSSLAGRRGNHTGKERCFSLEEEEESHWYHRVPPTSLKHCRPTLCVKPWLLSVMLSAPMVSEPRPEGGRKKGGRNTTFLMPADFVFG